MVLLVLNEPNASAKSLSSGPLLLLSIDLNGIRLQALRDPSEWIVSLPIDYSLISKLSKVDSTFLNSVGFQSLLFKENGELSR